LHVGDMAIAWEESPPVRLLDDYLDDDLSHVQVQDFKCVFFDGQSPIGGASFRTFGFVEEVSLEKFIDDADQTSQAAYELAIGLGQTADELMQIDTYSPGMRFVEFQRLEILPDQANGKWAKLANAFIDCRFSLNCVAMVLCPYPLEFELDSDKQELTEQEMEGMVRRREAMVRYYQKTLGVSLTVSGGARWWMGRLL